MPHRLQAYRASAKLQDGSRPIYIFKKKSNLLYILFQKNTLIYILCMYGTKVPKEA